MKALALSLAVCGIALLTSARAITPEETKAIAKEAWIYAFPMMESYNTWYPRRS